MTTITSCAVVADRLEAFGPEHQSEEQNEAAFLGVVPVLPGRQVTGSDGFVAAHWGLRCLRHWLRSAGHCCSASCAGGTLGADLHWDDGDLQAMSATKSACMSYTMESQRREKSGVGAGRTAGMCINAAGSGSVPLLEPRALMGRQLERTEEETL